MKYAILVFCLFAAACSQPLAPSAPSIVGTGVAGTGVAQTQASGGGPVEVTFTKWGTGIALPTHTGFAGGDVAGNFAGTVLSRDPFDNGTIVKLEARYEVTATNPARSFVAHIEGTLNTQTQKAVLNGTVTSGWNVGAQVHVTFDVIVPPVGASCVPQAPANRTCFQGVIRVMAGSAS